MLKLSGHVWHTMHKAEWTQEGILKLYVIILIIICALNFRLQALIEETLAEKERELLSTNDYFQTLLYKVKWFYNFC